ncbi:MAG: LamG domain-containing protein, partial [Verrucomicrobia bacterium]|nr:LamG domain-containing protein [Verrucomicrobiota bacterium]
LSVQTPYAKMDVPLHQILAIKMGDDHETASLDLRNGDMLKGVLTLAPVKLETVFGKVAIGVEHIRELHVVLAGGALPEGLKQGLVLHYSFDSDGGGKVTDQSGRTNAGEVKGAQWTPQGKMVGAYAFDGVDDYIAADVKGLEPGTKELTVACWVYASKMTPSAGLVCDRYHPLSLHCLRGLILDDRSATRQPAFLVPGGNVVAPEGTMKEGEWTHLVGVWKAGKTLRIYVNGKMSRSSDEKAPDVTSHKSGKWKIGWDEDQQPRRLNGLVDEIMIFDRALSEDEVKCIYASQK